MSKGNEGLQVLKNEEFHARRTAINPRGMAVFANFFIDRAKNAEIWDIEGNRYIDFIAGIAVLNTGHCHPKVISAVKNQLDRFTHTAFQVVPYVESVTLAERIIKQVPIEGEKRMGFFSTGAEAVENAIKIARASTGRSGVIAFNGGFHGRSLFAVALTGKVQPYKAGFGPFPAEIYHVPYPACAESFKEAKKAIDNLFKFDIEPSRVAAIIYEPVIGEGGYIPILKEAVQYLRTLCDQHGIVMIADEVQAGFGRTGKLFASEHFGVSPDIMTMAKGIAGGMVLSGVVGKANIMNGPAPGGIGGTYAGNPLGIAAAHAVLDVIAEEKLPERGATLGERLQVTLKEIAKTDKTLTGIRGLGAMVACDFVNDKGEPDADRAKAVQAAAQKKGLLILLCGNYGNTVRFMFPLTIEDSIFNEAMAILIEATKAA